MIYEDASPSAGTSSCANGQCSASTGGYTTSYTGGYVAPQAASGGCPNGRCNAGGSSAPATP
ncbi:MAG: hypothetical protein AAF497_21085, partial [Planctomycetota bacterium]